MSELSAARSLFTSSLSMASAMSGVVYTRALKAQEESAQHLVGATAITSAERGWSSMSDISPKNSPFPRVARTRYPLRTYTLPSRTTYKPTPHTP